MVLRIFELIAGRREEYVNERAFLPSITTSRSRMRVEKNSSRICRRYMIQTHKKKTARRRLSSSHGVVGLSGVECHFIAIVLPTIRHEADACEAEDHHCPCGGLGDGG
jgi:hypothetical protein